MKKGQWWFGSVQKLACYSNRSRQLHAPEILGFFGCWQYILSLLSSMCACFGIVELATANSIPALQSPQRAPLALSWVVSSQICDGRYQYQGFILAKKKTFWHGVLRCYGWRMCWATAMGNAETASKTALWHLRLCCLFGPLKNHCAPLQSCRRTCSQALGWVTVEDSFRKLCILSGNKPQGGR